MAEGETVEVEALLIVDSAGDYIISNSAEYIDQLWETECERSEARYRLKLIVPLPKAVPELRATLPERVTGAPLIVLKVEAVGQ